MNLKQSILVLPFVFSHGDMVKPATWHDPDRFENYFNPYGGHSDIGCGQLGLGNSLPVTQITGRDPDCVNEWYTDGLTNPTQQITIPDYAWKPEAACNDSPLRRDFD